MLTTHAIPIPVEQSRVRPRWVAAVLLFAASTYVIAGTGASLTLPRPSHSAARPTKAADAGGAQARAAGIDADVVADSVRHQVAPVAGHPGELVATDHGYRAVFDPSGFSFAPRGSHQPLRLSLHSLARGGRELGLAAGSWAAASGGAARRVSSGVREIVHVRSGETEWDVVLASEPAGRGALVLTAGLGGAAHIEKQVGGLRISLASGGHVRIGGMVVKDATGRVLYRAVPAADGGSLRLVVPDHVLLGARYPVTIDPTVGAEQAVGEASGSQEQSAIAFDGTNFLVVWADSRNGGFDIYGARVRADGTLLDTNGFVISAVGGVQEEPAVAYDGTHYLVVWQDHRNGPGSDIYASRVTTGGTVLDTAGVPFSTAPNDQTDPDLAFAGGTALVVWTDFRSGGNSDIYGARWTEAAGLESAGIAISTGPEGEGFPAVVYYGSNFLVVWQDLRSRTTRDIYATRVSTSGTVLDTGGVAFSDAAGDQTEPHLAYDGTDVLIVWRDTRTENSDIYGARWSPTTGLIDDDGLLIASAASQPSVAANGQFLVTWNSSAGISATRVSHSSGVLDPGGFVIGSGGDSAVTKGKDAKWAVTYQRSTDVFLRVAAPK